MEIRDIARDAIIISEDATLFDAVALMVEKQTNSLLVVNENGELSGEIGVSDLLDAIVPPDRDSDDILTALGTEESFAEAVQNAKDKEVRDFMHVDIQAVNVDDPLIAIAATAIAHQSARLPIVDQENHPIGIISRRGLKHILAKFLRIQDNH